jgi:glycosyltransferase involved in cell wall biosynthesis
MRILWFGDLAQTGFGTVTSDVGRALVALGADVRFVSQNEIGPDLPEPFHSRTVDATSLITSEGGVEGVATFVPDLIHGRSTVSLTNGEPWGDWKPEAVFLLGDFAGMRIFATPYLDAFRQVPTFHYAPIEGVGLPPRWAELWRVIKPIAMSEFGREQIAKVVGYAPPLVYHGVDTDTFHPVSPSTPIVIETAERTFTLTSKAACKAFFGGDPRQTWVLRTDRHMPRKLYNALLRSMTPVLAERPDVRLVLHCQPHDQGGFLPDSISKMPESVQDQVILTQRGGVFPRDALVALYNAADLYVSPSAEGFGLTIAEAVACGIPAVGLDYSSVPEVIGPAGRVVPVAHLTDNEYDHHWAVPDEDAFSRAVAYLLDHPHRRIDLGRHGPSHVAQSFRWDVAAEQFLTLALQEPGVPVRELVAA